MRLYRDKKKMICPGGALLLAVLVTAGICGEVRRTSLQKHLADEVFRFHVLANSDSEKDQALKMKVKERVISYMHGELPDSQSMEMTENWARLHLTEIHEIARMALEQEGCQDDVAVEVTNCYFPDKTYGDVTFPQGYYHALRIKIGEAKGQNWWCVLFPNLCFVDSIHAVVPEEGKEDLKEVLTEEEYEMVTATSKFRVKWFFFGS